jgi:hypothetical protein
MWTPREAATASAVLILSLLLSAPSQPTTSTNPQRRASAAATSSVLTAEATLTLVPLKIEFPAEDVGAGWQKVTIGLAIHNPTGYAELIDFPGGGEEILKVKEGAAYDAAVGYGASPADKPFYKPERSDAVAGSFYAFRLPPRTALCGIDVEDGAADSLGRRERVETLTAVAKIPKGTTPQTLIVSGFPDLDLSVKPADPPCLPSQEQVRLPDTVDLHSGRGLVVGFTKLVTGATASGIPRTWLHLALTNKYELGDYSVEDMQIWLIDDDWVARSAFAQAEETGCDIRSMPASVTIGPGQSMNVTVCYPGRPEHLPAFIVMQSRTPEWWYSVGPAR